MRGWGLGTLLFFWSCAEADTGGLLQGPSDAGSPASDSGGPNPLPDSGVTVPDSGGPIVPGPEAETFKSGTRLRAAVLDAGGGARRFHAWYDTVLGTYCAFERGTDGELYCLPVGSYANRFRSPNCRDPSVWVTACNQSQQYFLHDGNLNIRANLCDFDRLDPALRTGVYRAVGTERVDALYWGEQVSCVQDSAQGREALRLEVVPTSEFVFATASLQDRGGLLAVWRVTAADGAWQDLALVDQTRNTECRPVEGLDQCAAGSALATISEDFWQDSCTQPLAFGASRPECRPVAVLEREAPTGPLCDQSRVRLREPGAPYTGEVHRLAAGQCEPADGFYPAGLMTVGPLVNRSYFPALQRQQVGAGRLRIDRYFTTSLHPAPWTYESFIDAQTGSPCLLVPDPSEPGSSVCVDANEVTTSGFGYTDPSCQDPIGLQLLRDVLGCVAQPRAMVRMPTTDGTSSCFGQSVDYELLEVGPEYLGPVYWLNGDRCVPVDRSPAQGYRIYAHRLGQRRGWGGYPRLMQHIE